MFYWLFPRIFKTKLFSEKLANIHFWLDTLGIIFIAVPLYWAAVTQSLMWKEFTADGFLAYPNFLETVTQILPMYYTRVIGGCLYLTGAIIMVYNLIKTAKSGSFVADEAASAPPLEKAPSKRIFGEAVHSWLERKPVLFTIWALIAILIGGIVEIVPMYLIKSNIPTIENVKPYTPLELQGRDIYIGEGCVSCHSQMVRPFRSETERYGEYSKAGEFVYDHPFLWGSKRTGPDLARAGVISGKMFKPDSWHYNHLLNPQGMNAQSIMPPYPWLFTKDIDVASTPVKIRAMQTLGVPYGEGYDLKAEADLMEQAQKIANGLAESGIKIEPQKQIIALIAYMQRLGTDISNTPKSDAPKAEHSSHAKLPMPLPKDSEALAEAKQVYDKSCLICHGAMGEGNLIGPNLTDNYWIHGGSPEDIYQIIAVGFPTKGMQAWNTQLSEEQMVALTSYIINMHGTNPANAREPQGELYKTQISMK